MPLISFYKNKITEEIYETSDDPFQIILTHFDTHRGPVVFLASPPEVKPYIDTLVCNLLDLNLPEGFFEHRIVEKGLTLGNYIFEIESEWARGSIESLMLTVVLNSNQKFSSVKEFMLQIAEKFKTKINLYKGFYSEKEKKDEEIRDFLYFLNFTISSSVRFLERYLTSVQLGKILVIGNKKAGKQRLIDNISIDHQKLYVDMFKSASTFTDSNEITSITPGKLLLKQFLEQVEFWAYDLDTFPCTMWFEVCKNPIAIIAVFDPITPRDEIAQLHSNFQKVFEHYCSDRINEPKRSKIPIILLANESDKINNYSTEEIYGLIHFDHLALNSGFSLVSIEKNYGIEESLLWIITQLVDINK